MELQRLLLVVAVTACTVKVSHQGTNQHRLIKDLMIGYNSLTRPVDNDTEILTVQFGINLLQIMDLDEKSQVLTTSVWQQMYWNDNSLKWDPSEYPGVNNMRFPDHLIWKPDIMLYNSADERSVATRHTNILVNSSGLCSYIPPGIIKSTCSIDVRWFPFDVQRCDLKFGSWTYGGFSLDLKMMEADTSDYTSNGEWDLVEVTGKKNERLYECCEEPYFDVTYTVVMQRRTLYYGITLIIPCVLISTLAVLVFLLPADSGEKISLGITVLLSLSVFMLLVAEVMPATSNSVPLIAQYFATIMVIVGLSIIATVVVLHYHHHDPNGSKMPRLTRVILLEWCAWFLCMKCPDEDRHIKAPRSSLTSIELNATTSVPKSDNGNMPYRHLENIQSSTAATSADSSSPDESLAGRASKDEKLLSTGQRPSIGGMELELVKILEEVRYIAQRFHYQEKDKSVCNEWKFVAAVIDRLCLVAFCIFTFLGTIGILMSAPNKM